VVQKSALLLPELFLAALIAQQRVLELSQDCIGNMDVPEDLTETVTQHLRLLQDNPEDLIVESNLVELLLMIGELAECLRRVQKFVSRPEPRYQIAGRLFKGAALLLRGERDEAKSEFVWIGRYLISLGAVPGDFNWDFRDSRQVLTKLDLREAQLVFQILDKSLGFSEFQTRWQELEPAPV
jgi:hypothetical protein